MFLFSKASGYYYYFFALGTAEGKYLWSVMTWTQKSQTSTKRRCGSRTEPELGSAVKLSTWLALYCHSSIPLLMTTIITAAAVIALTWLTGMPDSSPFSHSFFFFFLKLKSDAFLALESIAFSLFTSMFGILTEHASTDHQRTADIPQKQNEL